MFKSTTTKNQTSVWFNIFSCGEVCNYSI